MPQAISRLQAVQMHLVTIVIWSFMSFEHRALKTEMYLFDLYAIHEKWFFNQIVYRVTVCTVWFSVINAKNINIVLGPAGILISHELITCKSKGVLGSLGEGPLYLWGDGLGNHLHSENCTKNVGATGKNWASTFQYDCDLWWFKIHSCTRSLTSMKSYTTWGWEKYCLTPFPLTKFNVPSIRLALLSLVRPREIYIHYCHLGGLYSKKLWPRLRPRAAFSSPRAKFFTIQTDSKLANNMFIFSCGNWLTNGIV